VADLRFEEKDAVMKPYDNLWQPKRRQIHTRWGHEDVLVPFCGANLYLFPNELRSIDGLDADDHFSLTCDDVLCDSY
jgi:hypothetical protein